MNYQDKEFESWMDEPDVSTMTDYELERGKPMPSYNHSRVERRLNTLLTPFEDKYDFMPELSLKLASGEGVPDLCVYPKLVFDFEKDIVKMTDPPLTTIEILSPTQPLDDVVKKIRDVYFPGGVKSAWVVLPSLKTIHLLMPGQKNLAFTEGMMTDPVTGISIEIGEVFK